MSLPKPTRPLVETPEAPIPEAPTPVRSYSQFRPSDTFVFTPAYDITAYELAELITIFFNGITLHFQRYSNLPDELKRHFHHKKII